MVTTIVNSSISAQRSTGTGNTWIISNSGGIYSAASGSYGFASSSPTASSIKISVHGEIIGARRGISFQGTSDGTATGAGDHQVYVGLTGVVEAAQNDGVGVFFKGDNNAIINHGQIYSPLDGVVFTEGTGHSVVNSGSIWGGNGTGIHFNSTIAGTATVENSGSIGGAIAIDAGATTLTVINTGTIQGDVVLSAGNDTFNGLTGSVFGAVKGGAGDDLYSVSDAAADLVELAGEGTDTVRASVDFKLAVNFENLTLMGGDDLRGFGNGLGNTITGNMGDNRMRGLGGNDVISGEEGDDVAFGGNGNDILSGGIGDDILKGGQNNDSLFGNFDDDVLRGQRGADTLYGGDGNDRLIGGLDKDVLYGGDGEDVFVFNRRADSPNNANLDVIQDFIRGEDLIDLSGLPGNLTFIGTGAFSGTTPEVKIIHWASGNSDVLVNLNGDTVADMRINVKSALLAEADFIL